MKLPDFQLERFFAQHEFSAKHLLCSSDCESMKIDDLLRLETGARKRFFNLSLGYTESTGSPQLRTAIAEIYKSIAPDDVLVFAGAEEAIYLFMQGLVGPQDDVIVHTPCYQSLLTLAQVNAAAVRPWRAAPETHWRLDMGELERLIRPSTRLIVINTPHNPTGWLMDARDWNELHRIAAERNIMVFCDEVYREAEYDPETRLPAGCDMGPHAISLGVMSKTYGLAGLRIGWIATRNQEFMTRLKSLKDYTTICNSAPSEFLAELALRHRDGLVARNLSLIAGNLQRLDSFFNEFEETFQWARPNAGSIAFPQLLRHDVNHFCNQLLDKAGVLLAPGSMFGFQGNHFRIGFGRADFRTGLETLTHYLRNHRV